MVKVEQSDRDVAAAYADQAIRMIGYAAKVQAGERDDSQLVQAFAAYRVEIMEQAANLARDEVNAFVNGPARTIYGTGFQNACHVIADKLENHGGTHDQG